MTIGNIGSPATAETDVKKADPKKLHDAAQQFEALMIGQMLKASHTGDGGWLGSEDSSSQSTTEMGEEQLANTLAASGGLGLARMITRDLSHS